MTTTDGGRTAPVAGVVLAEPVGRVAGRHRRRKGHRHSAKGTGGSVDGNGATRRHRKLPWVLGAVALLLIGGGTWVAVTRIDTPLSRPVAQPATMAQVVVPGASPALPWPSKGQGAVAVPSIHYAAQFGPESSVSIASLTKLTTAVVVLRDHPIPAGAEGPLVPVTAGDVAEYEDELHKDQSTVAIQVGEQVTERQMLEALLTQSANDIAFSLAMWDAGSIPAFVAKMNAFAVSLGTTATHYVDASGYDPRSVSSASDVLRVASAGMAIPTFAEVVAMPSVTLPLVGTLHNIVSEVGTNGVVGIKSGYTSVAGACMVLAANRKVRNQEVLVLVAVLGQPTPPPTLPKPLPPVAPPATTTTTTTAPPPSTSTDPAAPTTTTTTTAPPPPPPPPPPTPTTTSIPINDLPIADPFKFARPVTDALLTATAAAITPVPVATVGQVLGSVSASWGGVAHTASYATAAEAWLSGWPGQQVSSMTKFTSVAAGSPAGSRVGTALFAIGDQFVTVPLKLTQTVPEPSVWWRLAHS